MAWAGSMPAAELALLHAAQAGGAGALTRSAARPGPSRARGRTMPAHPPRHADGRRWRAVAVALALAAAAPYFTVPRLQAVFQDGAARLPGRPWHAASSRSRKGCARACPLLVGMRGRRHLAGAVVAAQSGRAVARSGWTAGWSGACIATSMPSVSWPCSPSLVRPRGNVDIRLRQALVHAGRSGRALAVLAYTRNGRAHRCRDGGRRQLRHGHDRSPYLVVPERHGRRPRHGRRVWTGPRDRIERRALAQLGRQAQVPALGSVARPRWPRSSPWRSWHYAAIDELRRALMHVHAAG